MPIGIPGELYIGGKQVGLGYINQPQLTKDKFIPNPFSNGSDCLYKSGDICRFLANGNVEYLSRADHQVKIHGLRIELGEIKHKLEQHATVKEAVVIAHDISGGEKIIIAYLVFHDSNKPSTDNELIQFLKLSLPDYMIPGAFVAMAFIPLLPNGKLDLSHLPLPERKKLTEYTPPKSDMEKSLTLIWSHILKVDNISIHDNFFDLGGHSILAIQLIHTIFVELNIEVSVSDLFHFPTIASMANRLQNNGISYSNEKLVFIQPHGKKTPIFAPHPAGGNVICYARLASNLGTERPFLGLQQCLDSTSTTIESMASEYIHIIKKKQSSGPYNLLGWSLGGVIAHEIAHQLESAGDEISFLGLVDCFIAQKVLHETPWREFDFMMYFLKDFRLSVQTQTHINPDDLSPINSEMDIVNFFEKAKEKNILSRQINTSDLFARYLKFKDNLKTLISHQPNQINSSMFLFSAKTVDNIIGELKTRDNAHEWQQYTRGTLTVRFVPGNHYSMLESANCDQLAQEINQHIDQN